MRKKGDGKIQKCNSVIYKGLLIAIESDYVEKWTDLILKSSTRLFK